MDAAVRIPQQGAVTAVHPPVGPIRLDLAHPFDDPDNSLRVHISLGPDL